VNIDHQNSVTCYDRRLIYTTHFSRELDCIAYEPVIPNSYSHRNATIGSSS